MHFYLNIVTRIKSLHLLFYSYDLSFYSTSPLHLFFHLAALFWPGNKSGGQVLIFHLESITEKKLVVNLFFVHLVSFGELSLFQAFYSMILNKILDDGVM